MKRDASDASETAEEMRKGDRELGCRNDLARRLCVALEGKTCVEWVKDTGKSHVGQIVS